MQKNKTKFNRNTQNDRRRDSRSRGPRGGKKVSSIDPNQLIKQAVYEEPKVFKASKTYNELDLNDQLKANLSRKGYTQPTEIQEASLEALLQMRNMVGVASTGTGKTGAFLIPLVERLMTDNNSFTTLIVVPTRELALQVEEEFKSLTKGMSLYSSCFIGGTNVDRDVAKLRRKNHFIIGTPGRLLDMASRGALRLKDISVLILDEFDRMLDMGFVHDIKRIVAAMGRREQTMLFSATMDPSQKGLIQELVNDPLIIKVSTGTSASSSVEQRILKVKEGEDKFQLLMDLISGDSFEKVIVFAETKRLVDRLSKKLNRSGVSTSYIHGDKTQNFRNRAISQFKNGSSRILVATDVAARGIDIDNVSHVINYQLPMTMDSYVHRIGRTGRAGNKGMAYTFVG